MSDENSEEKSFIYIEFADIGSAEIINWKFENVSPLQLLTISMFLEFEGKNSLAVQRAAQIQTQLEQEQRQKIAVPSPDIFTGKK